MIFFWIILGALIVSIIWFIHVRTAHRGGLTIGAWTLIIITTLIGALALGWTMESIYENEMQAAGLGMLILGGITVILAIITGRSIRKKLASR